MATNSEKTSERIRHRAPMKDGASDAQNGEITVEPTGGGWYEVKLDGIVKDKVQGRRAAEAAVTRIRMQR